MNISDPISSTGRIAYDPSVRMGRSTVRFHDASATIPAWKHTLDLCCILLTSPVWLPLMVLISVWIKLVSTGPVFFVQERVGFRGKNFMIFKFRSMVQNAETRCHEQHAKQLMDTGRPMTKLDASDRRIIPGGRILRATGLDELPQLFNVLMGTMSLVGPRPCLPHEFEHYTTHQRRRTQAPPGLTGYWQVNGKNKTTFAQMIELDIFYAKHMSVWLDLQIMLRTFPTLAAQLFEIKSRARFVSEPPREHLPQR